jgi:hypothetical protein
MLRISGFLHSIAIALVVYSNQSSYAQLIEYNFNGGTDGNFVSGNTGGATAGVLNSGVDAPFAHPNTLINAVTGTDLSAVFPQSIIKHWSDNPTTETAGGNFVGMTYDTSLPSGAETRAGYDGEAVQFVRSGVLHSNSNVPGSVTGFSAFARIYWQDNSLYGYETLFSNGSRLNQTSWWVGIDNAAKQLTWSFTNGAANSSIEHPHLAAISTPVLTPNTWVDVAVTFEGDATLGDLTDDTIKVYIDGTLFDTYVGPAQFLPAFNSLGDDWSFWTPGGNGSLQLGGSYSGLAPFHPEEFTGLMERFLYFNEVLSDAQVAALTIIPIIPEPSAILLTITAGVGILSSVRRRNCKFF